MNPQQVTTTGGAWAAGLATLTGDGRVLDTWFPAPALGVEAAGARLADDLGWTGGAATLELDRQRARAALGADLTRTDAAQELRRVRSVAVATFVEDLDALPVDAHDAWLRLHLLSHRLVAPHGCNLDGLFGLLSNVVWTSAGPCAVEGFEEVRLRLRASGQSVAVYGVDKFPRMTDYVIPTGVRIADADRVRLGAHLAEGTTVMHEGFVNFNAGTLGPAMVEGRISAGVVVGADSDIGGGASIAGTLSGGGKEVISVGRRCLLGANAGIGISLGDDCIVQAGLYVLAGTRVTRPDGQVVKAAELSGADGLLFRQNSQSGAVEALVRSGEWSEGLNPQLHQND